MKNSLLLCICAVTFIICRRIGDGKLERAKAIYEKPGNLTLVENGKLLNGLVKNAETAHLVQFYSATCGHCHDFAKIFLRFADQTAGWYCLIKVLTVECQGVNYSVCHRAPFWIPNYPTFRYFGAFDPDLKYRGMALNSTDETGSGLIRATIRFLEANPAPSWIYPTVQPLLGETGERDMKELFALQAAGSVRYVVLLVEDEEASAYDEYLTKRIILDMSSYQHIVIRRICKSTADRNDYFRPVLEEREKNPILVPTIWMESNVTFPANYTTDAPVTNYVDLFIWDQGGEQRQLYVELPHASFFVYELKRLDGIGNRTRVDDELKKKMADEVAKAKFSLAPGERLSPKTADAALIYISDFESTINHMLFKEMCAVEELHGARLDAVRSMVNAIGTYYKGRPAIMDLLGRINLLLGNLNQVDFNITFTF